MIRVDLEQYQFVADEASDLRVRLTNTARGPCTNLVFRLTLPVHIVLLKGSDQTEAARLEVGQSITFAVRVRPKRAGTFVLTSTNFSYRDSFGIPQRVTDLQLVIEVAPSRQTIKDSAVINSATNGTTGIEPIIPLSKAATNQRGRNKADIALESKIAIGDFDVFLCHNSMDKQAVKKIGKQLKQLGILPWLDVWELRPGLLWQKALEDQIRKIKSVAVFVGENGIGPWQDMEQAAFLRQFIKRECPVIPVILPNCKQIPKLPVFLEGMTWVDFRQRDPDPMEQLIWGITGKRSRA